MVDAVAAVALETLRDLVIEEAKFLSSVRGQVEEVRRELQIMHSFLQDADKRRDSYNSETVRDWVFKLRDLATQAEDVLERYAIQVQSKRQGKNLKDKLKRFTCILGECLNMHQIRNEIKDIRSRMADLTKRVEASMADLTKRAEASMKIGESSSNSVDHDIERSRKTYGHEIEQHFVGRKDDIQQLESLLTSDGDISNRVISICGMGGSGKTTLARKIYRGEAARRSFDVRVWVCISQQFQLKTVLQELLKQFLPSEENQIREMEENELGRKLLRVQDEKKCLVVVDDIWEVDHWNTLSRFFRIAEDHCRVLVTTRNEKIGAGEYYVHKLKYLSEDEGWELLQMIALPQDLPANKLQLLEDIGREMVSICGCLPLAISMIGGVLRSKRPERVVWKKVLDEIVLDPNNCKAKSVLEQVIVTSYNGLPYNLKKCFWYLGCFPEDQEIYAEQLYLLWIAERMISPKDRRLGETLRDVAERYLIKLADLNIVHVEMEDDNIRSYRLHDLIRDFSLSKGREGRFTGVVDTYDMGSVHLHPKRDDGKFRPRRNVQSLLVTGKEWTPRDWNVKLVSNNIGIYKSLKILILEGCKFENRKLPKGIEKLIRLKHLSIKSSVVEVLPTSICKLPCLQYLNLQTYSTIRLPNSINKLMRLRDLFLHARRSVVGGRKLKLNGLNMLETMVGFDSSIDDTTGLINMARLRELLDASIHDEDSLLKIVNHILHQQDQFREASLSIRAGCNLISSEVDGDSTLLKNTLMCYSLSRLEIKCCFRKLPAYQPQLGKKLLYLRLENCCITEDPMETLENLPMLECLIFSIKAYMGEKMVCRADGFPKLKDLMLFNLVKLAKWSVEKNAMSNLSFLYISECTKLTEFPEGLKFIPTLEKLNIASMPQEFVDRAREALEGQARDDYDNIRHIPSVQFFTSSNTESAAMPNAPGVSNG